MKRKFFYQALAVFIVVLAAVFFFLKKPAPVPRGTAVTSSLPLEAEKTRFKQAVSFQPSMSAEAGAPWISGTAAGQAVWRDNRTGLLWGPQLPKIIVQILEEAEVKKAQDACAQQEPKGAWFLPLTSEIDVAIVDGWQHVDITAANHWLVYTYVGKALAARGRVLDSKPNSMTYYVRCVARGQ